MRNKKLLLNFIFPLIATLITSLVFLLLSPIEYDHYLLSVENKYKKGAATDHYFYDLDGDTVSEHIFTNRYADSDMHVISFGKSKHGELRSSILHEMNFPFPFPKVPRVIFGDIDHDNKAETYFFVFVKDSLILLHVELFEDLALQRSFLLDTVLFHRNTENMGAFYHQFRDVDMDGTDELILLIRNGTPVFPRRLYIIDINDQKILKSPDAAVNMFQTPHYVYHPEKNKAFFIASSTASANLPPDMDLPYTDYSS